MDVVLKFPDVDPLNPPVLTMSEVAFKYSADKVIFNCVNLNANLESRICIVSLKLICMYGFRSKCLDVYFSAQVRNFENKFRRLKSAQIQWQITILGRLLFMLFQFFHFESISFSKLYCNTYEQFFTKLYSTCCLICVA